MAKKKVLTCQVTVRITPDELALLESIAFCTEGTVAGTIRLAIEDMLYKE